MKCVSHAGYWHSGVERDTMVLQDMLVLYCDLGDVFLSQSLFHGSSLLSLRHMFRIRDGYWQLLHLYGNSLEMVTDR